MKEEKLLLGTQSSAAEPSLFDLLRKQMRESLSNLFGSAIEPKILHTARIGATGRIHIGKEKTPWTQLPNVSAFTVKMGKIDQFFAFFGLKKRYNTEIELIPHQNKQANRYAIHQIRRLTKARKQKNSRLYFGMADILMKRSNVFRIMAINHVLPQWQRNLPFKMVLFWNNRVSRIVNHQLTKVTNVRHFVPKPNGKLRPIGCPSVEWRLYLHQQSNFLTHWLGPAMKNLHGFMPDRGLSTAWGTIAQLWEKPYVYEWDFRSFFDTLRKSKLWESLLQHQVPLDWIDRIKSLYDSPLELNHETWESQALPHRTISNAVHEEHKQFLKRWEALQDSFTTSLEEEIIREILTFARATRSVLIEDEGKYHLKIDGYHKLQLQQPASEKANNKWLEMLRVRKISNPHLLTFVQAPTGTRISPILITYHEKGKWYCQTGYNNPGVPQGWPTSPILANLASLAWIEWCQTRKVKVVMYADDCIGFSDHPLPKNITASTDRKKQGQMLWDWNLTFASEKCRYVKKDGQQLCPLKFLGMTLTSDQLAACTRKGATLGLDSFHLLMVNLFPVLHEKLNKLSAEEALQELEDHLSEKFEFTVSPPSIHERSTTGTTDVAGSWTRIFTSKTVGLVLNRLQNNSWTLEDIKQNFQMTYVTGSWLESRHNRWTLDTFNCSSYANHSLLLILRHRQKFRRPKKDKSFHLRITAH